MIEKSLVSLVLAISTKLFYIGILNPSGRESLRKNHETRLTRLRGGSFHFADGPKESRAPSHILNKLSF